MSRTHLAQGAADLKRPYIKRPSALVALICGAVETFGSAASGQPPPYRVAAVQSELKAAQAAQPLYRIVTETALGAPDAWDYVIFEPSSGRVFVAHADRLTVVDGRSGTIVGEVAVPSGVTHGVAVAPERRRGYTDDGKTGRVEVFDLDSLKVIGALRVASAPDAMTHEAKSGHVFVVNGDNHSVAVVDSMTNKLLTTIDAGEGLESALTDNAGHIYVNGSDKLDILRIDTATNRIDARWPVPDCASPHGLAMDTTAHRLFASCVNGKLVVVDIDTGREVAGAPIGFGSDSLGFDPVHKRVLSANGRSGTLSVILEAGADRYRLIDEMPTRRGGRTLAVDPATGRVFLAAADLQPSATPGARPQPVPGTLKLVILDPIR